MQVTRDPMGGKGPRLTMEVGIPGRYVVYLPGGKGSGVSRRLDGEERERLRAIGREVRPEAGGVIVRTAAEGAGKEALERDLRFLQRVWAGAERRALTASAPCARLRRGGVGRPERPRSARPRLRRRHRGRREAAPAPGELPAGRGARTQGPGGAVHRRHAAVRAFRPRAGDGEGACAPRRACLPAGTSSSTTPRR